MTLLGDLLSRLIQSIMFWWVRVAENPPHTDFKRIDSSSETPNLLYVLEHNSFADKLVLDKQCRRLGIQPALERMDGDFLPGQQPVWAVHDHRPLFGSNKENREKILCELIDFLSENPDEDVLLVPVAMYWGRAADNANPIKVLLLSLIHI